MRKAFDSRQVSVERPWFTENGNGSAKAIVHVMTAGIAKIPGAGFAGGVTSLPDELDDPICTYVRSLTGGATPLTVVVTNVDVALGEGALTAAIDSGDIGSADREQQPEERRRGALRPPSRGTTSELGSRSPQLSDRYAANGIPQCHGSQL